MILQYSLRYYRTVYVRRVKVSDSRVQFISLEYSLCSYSTLCVPRVSLCSHSTVYVPHYSLLHHSTVYVPRVQFISLEYSLCP